MNEYKRGRNISYKRCLHQNLDVFDESVDEVYSCDSEKAGDNGFLSVSFDEKIKSVRPTHGGLEYVVQTVNKSYSITAADFRRIGDDVLFAGNVLSEDVLEELAYSHEKLSCIQKALNHLSYSAMSEKKLKSKLYGKFSHDIIEDALEILKENGCINDFELAYSLCEEFYSVSKMGPLKIKAKLYQRQFSAETVAEVFERFEFDETTMFENMELLIERKFEDLSKKEDKGKAIDYLVRCGYPLDEAKSFVIRNKW